jgi:hypothetical protein
MSLLTRGTRRGGVAIMLYKNSGFFTLCCPFRTSMASTSAEISQPQTELRTDYFQVRSLPGSAGGWSRTTEFPELYYKELELWKEARRSSLRRGMLAKDLFAHPHKLSSRRIRNQAELEQKGPRVI